ncbi:MAG: hypothetical protein KDE22_15900 [Rhodobacterales bacterium]|nr:hypothetical protein [Rhodobacterales bacterium]
MFEIFSILAVAAGVAGLIHMGYRVTGRRPPRWAMPLGAGLSMVVFMIWNEYSWLSRTVETLPDTVTVVETHTYTAPWQPWTYVFPRVDRFLAVDKAEFQHNPNLPGLVLARSFRIKRNDATLTVQHLFDCTKGRRADLSPGTAFGQDGMPENPEWHEMTANDPLLVAVCAPS